MQVAEFLRANAEIARVNAELAKQLLQSGDNPANRPRPKLRPREIDIINAIGQGKMLGKQIAKAIGADYSTSLQGALADLTRFLILVNDGDGYSVSPAYRHLVQDLDDSADS